MAESNKVVQINSKMWQMAQYSTFVMVTGVGLCEGQDVFVEMWMRTGRVQNKVMGLMQEPLMQTVLFLSAEERVTFINFYVL